MPQCHEFLQGYPENVREVAISFVIVSPLVSLMEKQVHDLISGVHLQLGCPATCLSMRTDGKDSVAIMLAKAAAQPAEAYVQKFVHHVLD